MIQLAKYSMGIGDRFGRQGRAQLAAFVAARALGLDVTPVWNKSHREHTYIGTHPSSVRSEADEAVRALGWTGAYHVDADHIGRKNVDLFLQSSDFFTLDVADFIGEEPDEDDLRAFLVAHADLAAGPLDVPGLSEPIRLMPAELEAAARKFLRAVREAAAIYRRVAKARGADHVIAEVSMDETDVPQSPAELVVILAAVADEGIPAQTIAPRFSGRFNKGVDYVGNVARFAREFEADVLVTRWAAKRFGLPRNLKLSIHSGSDKFSIYGPIAEVLRRRDAGLHLKTAGTTWLEEIAGLAEAGGEGLAIAREIYAEALGHIRELCAPYASVIDIRADRLPAASEVAAWSGERLARALRHDPVCPDYNADMRQLVHVAYRLAAVMGERYFAALDRHAETVGRHVTDNILHRHLLRVFPA